jgi:putative serine protease PepD
MFDETPVDPPQPPPAPGPRYEVVTGPLPICEYTGDPTDEPCEEPSVVRRWSSAAVITSAALGSLVGGLLVATALVWAFGMWPGARPVQQSVVQSGVKPAEITIEPGENVNAAVAVAAKVTPSVVNVSIEQRSFDPFSGDTRLSEAGNGSGVIIREDGYILTNYHVIEGADRLVVTVGVDDLEAEVVGVDPSTDLAVIRVAGDGYPAIEIGSSADLAVGQFVVAVGSPFGLEKTVTSGIISALQRTGLAEGTADLTAYTNLIQTDAAINPGNSGGALVDETGKLIGINTLIQSPSGNVGAPQSAGIGFAIPVDAAMSVAAQLVETGSATHPYMGVSTSTIDEMTARQFALVVMRGALVQFVEPGSPAEVGGLRRGDIIIRIGEREISGTEDVFAAVRASEIGDVVQVTVVRADAERVFEIELGSDAQRR